VTVFAFGAGWLVKAFDLRRMLGATHARLTGARDR
jgi:hypothetical protein